MLNFVNVYKSFLGVNGKREGEKTKFHFHKHLILITEVKDDYPTDMEIPDFFFPFAEADITECSTYAVVCRLKSSPTYTITSSGGSFSHPDYPEVIVTIPEKAVTPAAKFPVELKVGVIAYVGFKGS